MRFRATFFTHLFVVVLLALPTVAQAAAIPFFGPIIPQDGNQAVCAAGWGMLITVINNIIAFLITIAIVFVAPLMIAYSGFLLVVSQGDSGKRTEARKILTNTIVGIVIALAGWMIVDAIMVVLYNPRAVSGETRLTAWSQLIVGSSSGLCIPLAGSLAPAVTPPPGVAGAGRFINNVGSQVPNESGQLSALLSCMSSKLTSDVTITSISDNKIALNQQTFLSCRTNGKPTCAHAANSCHYGGRNCGDFSYAVDLSGNATGITSAAQACGASYLNEGSHIHVSVGAQNNCGCDAGLE